MTDTKYQLLIPTKKYESGGFESPSPYNIDRYTSEMAIKQFKSKAEPQRSHNFKIPNFHCINSHNSCNFSELKLTKIAQFAFQKLHYFKIVKIALGFIIVQIGIA